MASVNKWIGIGNVCADPVTRYMSNGDAVTNITVACNESWKDKLGEKQEKTEFVRVTFYRKLAEIAGEYLKKGNPIYVEGRIETNKWTDKAGVERYTTDIVANEMKMLGSKTSGKREEPQSQPQEQKKYDGGPVTSNFDDMTDDIPFVSNVLYSNPEAISKAFLRARRGR